jgi:endonuclease/exonuclease/phosphatase family metal-dependent hydrolase
MFNAIIQKNSITFKPELFNLSNLPMKIFFYVLALLLVSIVSFYFWGSSSNISENEYSKIQSFEKFSNAVNDSIYTVVTYNIGYLSGMTNNTIVKPEKKLFNQNLSNAISLFDKIQADFIGFQEIDFGSQRSYNVNQFESLATSLGFQYGALAINWDKKYVPFPYYPPSVHFGQILSGQAILSRYPIIRHERTILEKVESNPFYYNAFYLDRLMEVAEIHVDNKKLVVINVHLEAFDPETRRKQSEYVLKVYKDFSSIAPVLLIGDFNSMPKSELNPNPEIDVFLNAENIASACPKDNFNLAGSQTYPSNNPIEQLDYIFYNPDKIEIIEWKVLSEFGEISDHFPVMMKFRFI